MIHTSSSNARNEKYRNHETTEVLVDAHACRHFDAGDLGCTDGFPRAFRSAVRQIAVGDRIRIVTRDPSAKQDLPSLSRMLGHRLLETEEHGDGRTIFTVERGR